MWVCRGGRSTLNLESEVGITLQIRGGLTLILGGVDRHSTWKVKLGLPCGSGVDQHWSRGGVNQHSTWKVKLGLPCGSGVDQHWSGRGGRSTLNLESEVGITLRIWGGSTLILGGSIDTQLGKWSWDYLADPGGSTLILGGSIDTQLGKWSWDYLADPGWINTDPGGGRSTLNLERICNDFGRITCATADPGGGHLSAPDIPWRSTGWPLVYFKTRKNCWRLFCFWEFWVSLFTWINVPCVFFVCMVVFTCVYVCFF